MFNIKARALYLSKYKINSLTYFKNHLNYCTETRNLKLKLIKVLLPWFSGIVLWCIINVFNYCLIFRTLQWDKCNFETSVTPDLLVNDKTFLLLFSKLTSGHVSPASYSQTKNVPLNCSKYNFKNSPLFYVKW